MTTDAIKRTDPQLLAAARGDDGCDLVLENGRVFNVFTRSAVDADVGIVGGRIAVVLSRDAGKIEGRERIDCSDLTLVPGFIDAHMHVESTMLPPTRFAALAAPHGTTAAVLDPHEIANVLGAAGIRWLADDLSRARFRGLLALSSCVPSSPLETSGAELDADALAELFADPSLSPRVVALAEMMNFPGVVHADAGVLAKVELGLRERIVDGHAPGLIGRGLQAYAAAGISSDHECTSAEEAAEKLALGMRVFIREGSSAKNMRALAPLVTAENAHRFCLCTDDRHPADLSRDGHIDHVLRRAIEEGVPPELALCAATINAAEHYRQPDLGAIAPGRLADIVAVDDVSTLVVQRVWLGGEEIARDGRALFEPPELRNPPRAPVTLPVGFGVESLRIDAGGAAGSVTCRVIGAHTDSLTSDDLRLDLPVRDGALKADPEQDVLKIAVIERHRGTGNIGIAFVRGFGIRNGAIASTVGHDAHNLAVVGDNDADMVAAARAVADAGGGQCVVAGGELRSLLRLPIAGLMSDEGPESVIDQQAALHRAACDHLGCPHDDPFMPLSFLPLPVIPHLKVSDLGLIDVDAFAPVEVIANDR